MNFNKKILLISSIVIATILIFTILFINISSNNKPQEINIETDIGDSTPPIIVLDDTYVVKTGYDKNLVDVIMSADDIDPNPQREILGDYDLNTAGEYNLIYKISDSSGNVTQKDFTLKVKDNYTYSENKILFEDAISKYKTENTSIRN